LSPYLQQRRLVEFCHKIGIAVTAYSPFCKGHEYKNNLGADVDIFKDPILEAIAKNHNKTVGQVILNFMYNDLKVVSIPKTQGVARLKENFNFRDFTLSEDEVKQIRTLDKGIRTLDPSTWEKMG